MGSVGLEDKKSFAWSFTWLVTPTMKMIVDDHTALQTLPVSIKKADREQIVGCWRRFSCSA